jgi:two-component system response regulator AtoC
VPHALIVDDDANFLMPLAELVEREGFTTSVASTLEDARSLMRSKPPDLVLVDLFLTDGTGLELLGELQSDGATEVVLITAHASVDTAVEALRKGASDYLTKPVDVPRLKTVLANTRRAHALREEVDTLRAELRKLGRFGSLVGISPPMQRVYDLLGRVAPTDATVLLVGESGTGKEVVAETLHALSRRRQGPFLPVDCGAISPTLIESELFGHERGSFTGAERTHRGLFERAVGGTVFLDEVTEMPYELQVKLLRVLETGAVVRIGGERPLPVDVRVIAATNRNPEEAVAQGKLREDLLYRLKVFPLHLPPLRERGDDIELLVQHFLTVLNQREGTAKRCSRAVLQRLRAYSWPGNVRELKNLVHQVFILADEEIDLGCLPQDFGGAEAPAGPSLHLKVGVSLAEADRRLVLATLNECKGDKRRAAEILGISLKTLYNRLKEYQAE